MKFVNRGEAVQVRESDGHNRFKWTLLKQGEIIELSEDVGINYGFEKMEITQGKIGKTKVETKQFNDSDFFNELKSINGIGAKTAKDIIEYAPTKEILIDKIKTRDGLPFRDDHEKLLRERYGK